MIAPVSPSSPDHLASSDRDVVAGVKDFHRKDSASDGSSEQGSHMEDSVDVSASTEPVVATDGSAQTWSFAYEQLAAQLEYYFSEKNLSKDTYLQTLRGLNDGCVPVKILANFAMVKRLIMALTFVVDEEGRLAAVEEAARNFSERLMVCSIDTKTGTRVTDQSEPYVDSLHGLLAIGTVDGKPLLLENNKIRPPPIVNTIVLRDIECGVTPEEIYELFNLEEFPRVKSIQPDVANCWFVTLDTEDKDVVRQVLLSLRSMTLRDHPVHARLKSIAIATLVDTAPVMPWVPPVPETACIVTKRKKKKLRGKKKKKTNSDNPGNAASKGKKRPGTATPLLTPPPPPPTLGEDNFPTLQDKKVEWETTPVVVGKTEELRISSGSEAGYYFDEDVRRINKLEDLEDDKDEPRSAKAMSDGASTATTTSSSLESVAKKTFPAIGYAAALMGVRPPALTEGRRDGIPPPTAHANNADYKSEVTQDREDQQISASSLPLPKQEAWGSRKSFADIIRGSREDSRRLS